jgi:hypothetical protein
MKTFGALAPWRSFRLARCGGFLFVVFCLFTPTNSLHAQWIQTNGPYGGFVYSYALSGTNLFAGTEGGVFLSTNNGTTWTAASTGLTNTVVRALAVSGTNIFAGTDGGGVFLSTNNGTSWTAASTGLTNTTVYALAVSGTNLFAGTYGDGVFLSSNNGSSWTAASAGLTNNIVYSLAVSGTNLFAGTNGGVWRRPLSEMVSVRFSSNELPAQFSLGQNYPNPFNPVTTISFNLPSKSFVSLKVFDALGREVSILFAEELPAGTYARQWNASQTAGGLAADLSSGVYFYRLQAGDFVSTKKLILLK